MEVDMPDDLVFRFGFSFQKKDYNAQTFIPEDKMNYESIERMCDEIACSLRCSCVRHGIVHNPLDDFGENLGHGEQSNISTSSDFDKSKVIGTPD